MRTWTVVLTLGLALSGCGDRDGDGLAWGQEREHGSDPGLADSDGDGLADGVEVNELGTDPTLADTDCDGFTDGEEYSAGTDALDAMSYDRDRETHWPDLRCHIPDGTDIGYGRGQTMAVPIGIDQHGEELDLGRFYGNIVMIDLSAGWCGPCRAAASDAEEIYDTLKGDGFVLVHAITDDFTNDEQLSDETFVADWADEYGLSFPVTDGGVDLMPKLEAEGFNSADGIPFFMILDRRLQPIDEVNGWAPEARDIVIEFFQDEIFPEHPPLF